MTRPPVVVDANVFLRFIVRAETPQDAENSSVAASLFGQCEEGLLEITTNAAVIAEVIFMLSSKHHYRLTRADTVSHLLPLLQLPGCVVPEKNQVIFALHRWQGSDKLSFVDALVIEQALNDRAPVASFDRDVCKVPDITVWSGS